MIAAAFLAFLQYLRLLSQLTSPALPRIGCNFLSSLPPGFHPDQRQTGAVQATHTAVQLLSAGEPSPALAGEDPEQQPVFMAWHV